MAYIYIYTYRARFGTVVTLNPTILHRSAQQASAPRYTCNARLAASCSQVPSKGARWPFNAVNACWSAAASFRRMF